MPCQFSDLCGILFACCSEESMKKILMLAFCSFLIGLLLKSTAPAQNVTGPQMVVTERSHDFKEVYEGSVLEHAFKVMNRGSQVLEIKRVRPS
jgi:hypothetical protein